MVTLKIAMPHHVKKIIITINHKLHFFSKKTKKKYLSGSRWTHTVLFRGKGKGTICRLPEIRFNSRPDVVDWCKAWVNLCQWGYIDQQNGTMAEQNGRIQCKNRDSRYVRTPGINRWKMIYEEGNVNNFICSVLNPCWVIII